MHTCLDDDQNVVPEFVLESQHSATVQLEGLDGRIVHGDHRGGLHAYHRTVDIIKEALVKSVAKGEK